MKEENPKGKEEPPNNNKMPQQDEKLTNSGMKSRSGMVVKILPPVGRKSLDMVEAMVQTLYVYVCDFL